MHGDRTFGSLVDVILGILIPTGVMRIPILDSFSDRGALGGSCGNTLLEDAHISLKSIYIYISVHLVL